MGSKRGLRAQLAGTSLADLIETGLQAVLAVDRARITADPPRYIVDSLALDDCAQSTGEWDYLLGIDELRGRPVVGIEVHPATNGEVDNIIAKKRRTIASMSKLDLQVAAEGFHWLWISSGADTVARGSTEYRKLSKERIELVGRRLRLPRTSK